MQGVPIALVVAEHQRRRTCLPGLSAALQQRLVRRGERRVLAGEQVGPPVGDRGPLLLERGPRALEELRQRMPEVAIAAVTEAMAGHIDRRAEPVTVEQVGELDALG